MDTLTRKALLGKAAAAAGVLATPALLPRLVMAAPPPAFTVLGPVADLRDGKVRLHLPAGFQYRSFHDTDGPAIFLDDGSRLTGRHDGMSAFPESSGNVWLVRNHAHNGSALSGALGGAGTPYDSSALGGTTTSLVTPFGEVVEAWTSLSGTQLNSGGAGTPWGSWLTCEETVNGPDVFDDFTRNIPFPSPPTTYIQNARLTKPHGFIFEVPAGGQSNREPIMHAGRFAHAAAAFCPDDGAVYVTENNFAFASGFYRYVPPSDPRAVGQVEDGGRLEALKVVGVVEAHLEGNQVNGATYAVEWVEIEEPFPGPDGLFPMNGDVPSVTNDLASVFVGLQGRALGAAHFSRIEGAVYARGEIYFTSMQGGGPAETVVQDDATGYGNGTGQVWSYNARTSTLTCRYQAPSGATLDLPDHITAKSGRGAILVCEDGPAPNHIRGLTRDAQLFDIALNRLTRNADGAPRFAEGFAGATFAPGTDTLYVNIEGSAGISFTIWGPWGRIGV